MVAHQQIHVIEAWTCHLTTEEGLSPATVKAYLKVVGLCLASRYASMSSSQSRGWFSLTL